MLGYFPEFYDDELLYSIIARYHLYSGNKNKRNTIIDVFNAPNLVPVIEFPSNLKTIEENLCSYMNITCKDIIAKHTMFPYYAPFLPQKRKLFLIENMILGQGKGIKMQIGYVAGSICQKKSLYYCSVCVEQDSKKYGEAYFYRIHQLQGVLVCHKHECYLKQYTINPIDESRLMFINLDSGIVKNDVTYEGNPKTFKHLLDIAKSAKYLLSNNLEDYNQDNIHSKYFGYLKEKGFLTAKGRVSQWDLFNEFILYYGEDVLRLLESEIDFDNEYNWLKVLTRKQKRVVHPLRQILFINFLCGDIHSFFKNTTKTLKSCSSYPCLNPAAEHYMKNVIKKVNITADYKTRESVGTFYCDCGFIYSRKMKCDIHKVGRIKEFGNAWENKLKGLITGKETSIKGIAKEMCCDSKTVVKYARKLGIDNYLNSYMHIKEAPKSDLHSDNSLLVRYKEDIKKLIESSPDIGRTAIRKRLENQYMYLYRYDKEWFDANMPRIQSKSIQRSELRNWALTDNQLLSLLKQTYNRILKEQLKSRISKTLLFRKSKKQSFFENHINKLPRCKAFIEANIESVEQFQIRRVNKACKEIMEQDRELKRWEVIRKAGLRLTLSSRVNAFIETIIKNQ
jgi:hypothetical protein